jgi:hypothetical protein
MANNENEPWVQLATRIPKQLHRDLKLHCVKSDVSVMQFVVDSIKDRLGKHGSGTGASGKPANGRRKRGQQAA